MAIRERYINPFTDFGFKKLFGSEYNKDLLIDFLNQVLGDREQIKDLTYLNTEKLGKTGSDRKAIFDLYCENEMKMRKATSLSLSCRMYRSSTSKTAVFSTLPFPYKSKHRKAIIGIIT